MAIVSLPILLKSNLDLVEDLPVDDRLPDCSHLLPVRLIPPVDFPHTDVSLVGQDRVDLAASDITPERLMVVLLNLLGCSFDRLFLQVRGEDLLHSSTFRNGEGQRVRTISVLDSKSCLLPPFHGVPRLVSVASLFPVNPEVGKTNAAKKKGVAFPKRVILEIDAK